MAAQKKMSGVMILKEFFGYKPGQTLKDFNEELKALSPEEKQALIEDASRALGYEVEVQAAKAA